MRMRANRSIALRTVARKFGSRESERATYLGEGLQHAGRRTLCGKSFPDRIHRSPCLFAAPIFFGLVTRNGRQVATYVGKCPSD
jgi:hypothetical protein